MIKYPWNVVFELLLQVWTVQSKTKNYSMMLKLNITIAAQVDTPRHYIQFNDLWHYSILVSPIAISLIICYHDYLIGENQRAKN